MTYAMFLALFLVIPIVLLGFATWRDFRNKLRSSQRFNKFPGWLAVAIHVLLAAFYTTPWDNYLVATGVWYYNPKLVAGIALGWVPIEEYTFFVLQTILTGLWYLWLSRRNQIQETGLLQPLRLRRSMVMGLGILWLSTLLILVSGWKPTTYLCLILAWALPPTASMSRPSASLLVRNAVTASTASTSRMEKGTVSQ